MFIVKTAWINQRRWGRPKQDGPKPVDNDMMKLTSSLHPAQSECASKLVTEGFRMKIFDKLKIRKAKPDKNDLEPEFWQERWQVLDADGTVLREFIGDAAEHEAGQYRDFIKGLKLHDVDQMIISLSKQLRNAHETIKALEDEIRSLRKSLDEK